MNPIDPAEAPQLWLTLDLLVPIARWPACWLTRSRPHSEFEQALKDGRLAVVVPEEIVRWMQAQD